MLKQRVITALVAVAVLLGVLFYAPQPLALAIIGAMFAAAAWEWSQFLGTTAKPIRWLFVALVVVCEVLLATVFAGAGLEAPILYAALIWWTAAFVWTFFFPTPVPAIAAWIGGLMMLLPAYVALIALYNLSPWWLLALLLIVWTADVGAYFSGKTFGRVKLAPAISPGKTWEGVIGGLLLVLVAVAVIASRQGFPMTIALPFCAAVALVSIVGDLTVSMFKRHTGIKDSGTLFPGHGGVLDRVDSVSAAAPLFAIGLQWFGTA